MAVKPLRRVLIFAYFFPPLGGAGVQRIAKFAKYLPEQGWLPTVVTVRARDYWMSDPSLEGELGSRVAVVRTRSLTGLALMRRLAPAQAGRKGGVRSSAGGIRRHQPRLPLVRRWHLERNQRHDLGCAKRRTP